MSARSPHEVVAHEDGYYLVLSGRSGKTYRVTPWATGRGANCECPGWIHARRCDHVTAVVVFASKRAPVDVTEILAQSEREIAEESPFMRARRERAERTRAELARDPFARVRGNR